MALANTITKTNINTFAEWMNIHPLSFNNLDLSSCFDDFTAICAFWNQYPYNNPVFLSRETLAKTLMLSEAKVENVVNTTIRPTFIMGETKSYLDNEYFDKSRRTQMPITSQKFMTNYMNIDGFGQKKLELIESDVIVSYHDDDFDTIYELARSTIDVTNVDNFDSKNIKVYYQGHFGDPKYEIRFTVVSVIDNILTITMNFYEMLRLENIFTTSFVRQRALSACNQNLFQQLIDVGYETLDTTMPHGKIYFTDLGCTNGCEESFVYFCATILDEHLGIFSIIPKEIDEEGHLIINSSVCISGRITRIEYNYHTYTNDELLQEAVFVLTAANLPLNLCNCDCIHSYLEHLQVDTALRTKESNFTIPFSLMGNEFGSKVGELEAYKLVQFYLETNGK